jgi:uncharacterized protein (UPF0371 family)
LEGTLYQLKFAVFYTAGFSSKLITMNTTDLIQHQNVAFDLEKYKKLQKEKINERIQKFSQGKLYLEIGGKFLYDSHAQRILPGYEVDTKKQLFFDLKDKMDILFCVDANDIQKNRQLKNTNETYAEVSLEMMDEIKEKLKITVSVVINLCNGVNRESIVKFENDVNERGYRVYKRYFVDGYPNDIQKILSKDGYGKDDHFQTEKRLILVTGAASNSGKMSTCLGQIYLDHTKGQDSGYAKFETFPVWNLPLKHPINLAYEAATADVGDYNTLDKYHKNAYNEDSVNYNRDVESFEILLGVAKHFVSKDNHMRNYKSPTDMGINETGFCITDEKAVCIACLEEIKRRASWYQEMVDRDNGDISWVERCNKLAQEAQEYIQGNF